MYCIVEFLDEGGVEVVPGTWIEGERSYWPPYDSRDRCDRAVTRAEPPGESWEMFRVRIRATRGKL